MTRILVIGNSHTRMLKRALPQHLSAASNSKVDYDICWLKAAGSTFGDTSKEEALAKIAQLDEGDLLVLTFLGTIHNVIGLLEHDVPFSLLETVDGPVHPPPDREIIPLSTMRSMLNQKIRSEDLVASFSRAARCPTVHLMPPPPKEHIKKRLRPSSQEPDEGVLPEEEIQFAPPQCRLALWKLEASLVGQYLAELPVQHLQYPPGTVDAKGYLAEAYQAPDVTHANSNYGRLVLEQVNGLPGRRVTN